ncbi:MAG: Sua5/YciO/YrdC/YwlC family protein [Porphyromonadaceae bacterium]|nr:Sua5/YciO/YrdC/YwlC family protein [Porphyromonadaceae bacterium]
MKLKFEIRKGSLTPGGNIPYEYHTQIREHLQKGGIIICPSDTCYSIAAACLPNALKIGDYLNSILNRNPQWPFSVAFDHAMRAKEYIRDPNGVCIKLLEHFTPGPITAISIIAREKIYLSEIIHSEKDDTIGIRIPDSCIESKLAELAGHPITTVPAKVGEEAPPIRDYESARDCIIDSIEKHGLSELVPLAGIEGTNGFTDKLSTVVRVKEELGPNSKLEVLREEYITKVMLKGFLDKHNLNWSITKGNR